MPTYEYECEKCAHFLEVFQSIKDPPLRRCPKCRGKLRRLVGTGAGIIFKGSGFYQTDYRSESYKKAEKAEKTGGTEKPSADAAKPAKKEKPERKDKT
jgi:putative FmdB family regulatory protein